MGRDPNSLYRSVAECLFKSQRFYTDVKDEVEDFLRNQNNSSSSNTDFFDDDDDDIFVNDDSSTHQAAKAVAKIYDVDIEIVSACDSLCEPVVITPESVDDEYHNYFNNDDDGKQKAGCDVCDANDSRWAAYYNFLNKVTKSSCTRI